LLRKLLLVPLVAEVAGATSEAVSVNVTTTPFERVVSDWGVVNVTRVGVVIGAVLAGADVVLGVVVGATEAAEDVDVAIVEVDVVESVDDADVLVGVVAVVLQSHQIIEIDITGITQAEGNSRAGNGYRSRRGTRARDYGSCSRKMSLLTAGWRASWNAP
jgi:hypothetical protein